MTLSRYVKDGRLAIVKKGRNTFYDEHEVASLVLEIENNKKKVGIEIKPKEKIELPKEVLQSVANVSGGDNLTAVGYEYLSTTTGYLIDMGLYEECDKNILVLYALSCQNYFKYLHSADENDCLITSDSGVTTVHPHFKVAQHHEKQMLVYMDRLGLNPLSRQKFPVKEQEQYDEMRDFIID
jgi:P27 family predicted phage terminase small subunit